MHYSARHNMYLDLYAFFKYFVWFHQLPGYFTSRAGLSMRSIFKRHADRVENYIDCTSIQEMALR